MKKLSRLVVRSFIGPFSLTFILILFILLMQFVWKYLDDMVGKGLDWTIIAELLIFQSTNLVPMALPLAILLSSIMTFGNLAEHYELVALKSSGMSLFKIMRPLIILICFISLGAFFFSNNITPYANLKSKSLLHDIVYHQPLQEVKEGVFFNGLGGFSIRIGKKHNSGDLEDVLIYDHRVPDRRCSRVIRAERGVMSKSISGRYMILTLYDGVSYDDQSERPKRRNGYRKTPHVSTVFEEMELRIDITALVFKESDEEKWENNIPMQDMSQLSSTADSLDLKVLKRMDNLDRYMLKAYHLTRDTIKKDTLYQAADINVFIGALAPKKKGRLLRVAYNMANNSSVYLNSAKEDIDNRRTFIDRHWNEWHRKFTLSFACILLFFIGGPLGAIIKKGGLGLPVVFSIVFFLIYHMTSITGEKMVNSGSLEPYQGMWLSALTLLPIAVFLTVKAANDSALFDRSAYEKMFSRLRSKKNQV